MANGSLLEFLRKERINLLLKESTDLEDYVVSAICFKCHCMNPIDATESYSSGLGVPFS
jgi:hypothetical protein